MTLALIAAQANNHVIGRGNLIPWKVDGEQQLFKSITMGGTLIMGRKTHNGIGRPLPGRRTIVVTRNDKLKFNGCSVCNSLETALNRAEAFDQPIFIAGGGELYRQAIGKVEEIHLTTIDIEVEGDIYFPEVPKDFKIIDQQHYSTNFNYTYQLLRRN